jgi:hypothetical protein
MMRDQQAGKLDHVLRLGRIQADAADIRLQPLDAERDELLRRVRDRKQLRSRAFTDLSVACADSTTATSSSNGVR